MNSWNISGEILRHGIKGTKFPKLWIHVGIPNPINSSIRDNNVFVNFEIDPNPNSKLGKIADFVKDKLQSSTFIFLSDLMVANVPKSKKLDDGTWDTTDAPGLKGKLFNIYLSTTRFPPINQGFVEGTVSKYAYDASDNSEKFIIDDKYRNVSTNEWKTRPVPILSDKPSNSINLTSKRVFIDGSICGVTPLGDSKIYIWSNQKIVMS